MFMPSSMIRAGKLTSSLFERSSPSWEWPWDHTITSVFARCSSRLDSLRGTFVKNSISIRPASIQDSRNRVDFDIDWLGTGPPVVPSDYSNVTPAAMVVILAKIDTPGIKRTSCAPKRSPRRDLDYVHVLVTPFNKASSHVGGSSWIPLAYDVIHNNNAQSMHPEPSGRAKISPFSITKNRNDPSMERIASLQALQRWRPLKSYIEQRFGHRTNE